MTENRAMKILSKSELFHFSSFYTVLGKGLRKQEKFIFLTCYREPGRAIGNIQEGKIKILILHESGHCFDFRLDFYDDFLR